jgi:hypothetical protein
MSSAVFALRGLTADHFEQIDQPNGKPTFVPTKAAGNWAWRRGRSGDLDEKGERWARQLVAARKSYEQATWI